MRKQTTTNPPETGITGKPACQKTISAIVAGHEGGHLKEFQ